MARPEKEQAVAELAEKIDGARTIILTDFTGMDVLSISELRRKCREAAVEYRVVKNTLTRFASLKSRHSFLADQLEGPTALAMSATDELAPARVISEFRRQHQVPKIKLGLVEGRVVNSRDVERLAFLPPKQVLLGQFAGALKTPVSMLSFALSSKLRQLLLVIGGLKEKKAE